MSSGVSVYYLWNSYSSGPNCGGSNRCVCKCTEAAMEASCQTVPDSAWHALALLLLLWIVRRYGEDDDGDADDSDKARAMYS